VRRADFLLTGGIDHLNHGGYGATPRSVLEAAQGWRLQMETDPSSFFRQSLPGLLRRAADRVGGFLGGRGDDWADSWTVVCVYAVDLPASEPRCAGGDVYDQWRIGRDACHSCDGREPGRHNYVFDSILGINRNDGSERSDEYILGRQLVDGNSGVFQARGLSRGAEYGESFGRCDEG